MTHTNLSKIIHPKNIEEYNTILQTSKACLVDFGAVWCGPCRMLEKELTKIVEKENAFPNVTVMKIDVENSDFTKIVEDNNIESIPRLLFYKEGSVVHDMVGADIATIKKKMAELN